MERGLTKYVKILLADKRVDPGADNNDAIQSAVCNSHHKMVKYY